MTCRHQCRPEDRHRWFFSVEEAKAFIEHRAKVIQEFEKRQVKISTILYSPNSMSVAIINGKTLGEGDALDQEGQILVQEIGENYLIFETEGVEIKKHQK